MRTRPLLAAVPSPPTVSTRPPLDAMLRPAANVRPPPDALVPLPRSACRAPAAHRRRSRPDAQPPAVSCLARPGAKAQPPTRPPAPALAAEMIAIPERRTRSLRSSHSGLHPTQRRCVQTTGSTRPQAHSSRCRRSRSRVRPGRRSPRRTRLGRSQKPHDAPALNTSRPLAAPAPR